MVLRKRTVFLRASQNFRRKRHRSASHFCPGHPLGIDHKIAHDRHCVTFGRQQQLKHHVRAVQEFEFDGSEIKFPHSAEAFVVDRSSPGSIHGETLAPMLHGGIDSAAAALPCRRTTDHSAPSQRRFRRAQARRRRERYICG